jgi:uncharacterized delta-60 repeat protein
LKLLRSARFHPDGAIDALFGTEGQGVARFNDEQFGHLTSAGLHLLPRSDGKIVVVGFVSTGEHEIALARFNPDGTLDETFGSAGMVRTRVVVDAPPFGGTGADINDAAFQADGKILVVAKVTGTVGNVQGHFRGILVRYDAQGHLDATFGNGGTLVAHPPAGTGSYSAAIAVQSDRRIVTAGGYPIASQGTFLPGMLTRYDEDGQVDVTFGNHGVAPSIAASQPGLQLAPRRLIVDEAGNLLVGGEVFGIASGLGIVRYASSGALDLSFGGNGIAIAPLPRLFSAHDLLRAGGTLIVGGTSEVDDPILGVTRDFTVTDYASVGAIDSSFSTTYTAMGDGDDNLKALAASPDAKIVAAGSSERNHIKYWALARYELRDGSTTTTTTSGSGTETSTSTTRPSQGDCATNPRCALDAATTSPACKDISVPRRILAQLSRAASLIAQHADSAGKARRRALRKAARRLNRARAILRDVASRRDRPLTSACTTEILDAIAQQLATLSVP